MRRFRLVLISFGVAAVLYSCQHSDRDRTAPGGVPAQSPATRSQNERAGNQETGSPDVAVPAAGKEPIRRSLVTAMANARFADRYSITVEAVTQSERSVQAGTANLMSGDSIRISVTDAVNSGSHWEAVVVPPGHSGTSVTVERIGRDSIVVKRCDGDYGFCGKSIKLFFDLESKKALGSVEFLPVEVSQFVVKDDGFYSIAEPEGHGYIIARYDSGRPRLLTGAEKMPSLRPSQCRNRLNIGRTAGVFSRAARSMHLSILTYSPMTTSRSRQNPGFGSRAERVSSKLELRVSSSARCAVTTCTLCRNPRPMRFSNGGQSYAAGSLNKGRCRKRSALIPSSETVCGSERPFMMVKELSERELWATSI